MKVWRRCGGGQISNIQQLLLGNLQKMSKGTNHLKILAEVSKIDLMLTILFHQNKRLYNCTYTIISDDLVQCQV